MSRYTIELTETEAKAIVNLTTDTIVSKTLKPSVIQALLRISNKIEQQSNWSTFKW